MLEANAIGLRGREWWWLSRVSSCFGSERTPANKKVGVRTYLIVLPCFVTYSHSGINKPFAKHKYTDQTRMSVAGRIRLALRYSVNVQYDVYNDAYI